MPSIQPGSGDDFLCQALGLELDAELELELESDDPD
jgi:hypothetical protein